jgi:hypothetical protein
MVDQPQIQLTKHQRYYELHREERNAKRLARYYNDPNVIAKREEKERKKAEKETTLAAEKELKRLQKEHMHQKKMEAAIASQKHGNPLGPPVVSK